MAQIRIVLAFSLTALLATPAAQAGPLDPTRHADPESAQAVHDAEHEVDHAWELYHRAALGGTVASPALQADIEEHLHDARALVTEAHEAAERGDRRLVDRLMMQVKMHTAHAIAGSKEQKR